MNAVPATGDRQSDCQVAEFVGGIADEPGQRGATEVGHGKHDGSDARGRRSNSYDKAGDVIG